jgi:DNA-3-methyladenine glycosylase II
MSMSQQPDAFALAQQHLAEKDRVLKRLIEAVGPCTLQVGIDPFEVLVRSIVSQLISTKAALSVFGRVRAALGEQGLTPAAVLALEEETLRGAGLSTAKARAIRELAARVHSRELDLEGLKQHGDDEVMAQLLPVRGIGNWTAHMFLMFGLGRLNVLPVGDMGLRAAVQEHYRLPDLPDAKTLQRKAKKWQPYCTVATWYMWRSRGWVPQSSQTPETA